MGEFDEASDVVKAHRHSIDHREAVLSSDRCGCFYCLKTYGPEAITEWVDGGDTALCPRCGIDSVLGSSSGFPIETEFLRAMRKQFF